MARDPGVKEERISEVWLYYSLCTPVLYLYCIVLIYLHSASQQYNIQLGKIRMTIYINIKVGYECTVVGPTANHTAESSCICS